MLSDNQGACRVGARAITHPELTTMRIPNAIAGAFQDNLLRQFLDRVELSLRMQRLKCGGEDGLLPLTLRMPETRQQRFAVEHDGGVCREDEIRKAGFRIDELDRRSLVEKRVVECGPLPIRRLI